MSAVRLTSEFDQAVASFRQLSADGKLTVLWNVFTHLKSLDTKVAPAAELSQVVQTLIQQFNQVKRLEKIEVLKEIVSGVETRFSHEYSALSANMKLAFWYRVIQDSGLNSPDRVATDSTGTDSLPTVLSKIDAMDSNQHIYFLQCILDEAA